jgi:hypothetical protein
MDGNQDHDEMVVDVRAMKDVGIGSILFLEVDTETHIVLSGFLPSMQLSQNERCLTHDLVHLRASLRTEQ